LHTYIYSLRTINESPFCEFMRTAKRHISAATTSTLCRKMLRIYGKIPSLTIRSAEALLDEVLKRAKELEESADHLAFLNKNIFTFGTLCYFLQEPVLAVKKAEAKYRPGVYLGRAEDEPSGHRVGHYVLDKRRKKEPWRFAESTSRHVKGTNYFVSDVTALQNAEHKKTIEIAHPLVEKIGDGGFKRGFTCS
jgi:hypothetical protein